MLNHSMVLSGLLLILTPPTAFAAAAAAACGELALEHLDEPQARSRTARARTMPRRHRPLETSEVGDLLSALESVELGRGLGWSTPAATGKGPLSRERIGEVLGDVTAALAHLHTVETLERIARMPDFDPERRKWLEKSLGALQECAKGHFSASGGDPAFQSTIRIVREHRVRFEETLMRSLENRKPILEGK